MGDINVFTGPMKCGKTQKMLNELDRQSITGKEIKIFKPTIDNRFGDNIIQTRLGKMTKAINIDSIEELKNYDADIYFYDTKMKVQERLAFRRLCNIKAGKEG